MLSSFMAALKAIPAIVDGIKEIKHTLELIADKRTDAKIAEILAEVRAATDKFEATGDRDEMLKIVRDLSLATTK